LATLCRPTTTKRAPHPFGPGSRRTATRTRPSSRRLRQSVLRGDPSNRGDLSDREERQRQAGVPRSTRSHPRSAPYPAGTDRGTTQLQHARDRHSPSRVMVGRPIIERRSTALPGSKDLKRGGRRTHSGRKNRGSKEAPGVPQPIQELLGRRSLGGGILELSAEAHTPAYAIRRKIAIGVISNPRDSQTRNGTNFSAGLTRSCLARSDGVRPVRSAAPAGRRPPRRPTAPDPARRRATGRPWPHRPSATRRLPRWAQTCRRRPT
jgi:hypothetical protein